MIVFDFLRSTDHNSPPSVGLRRFCGPQRHPIGTTKRPPGEGFHKGGAASLCSYVAMWLRGSVVMQLRSYVAIWLRGYVAMWPQFMENIRAEVKQP